MVCHYITIYNRISTWKKGNKIHFFRIHGTTLLRIDENKVNQDNLGDIPEIESYAIPEIEEATPEQIAHVKKLEKQIAELESQPSQVELKPEPPKSSKRISSKRNYFRNSSRTRSHHLNQFQNQKKLHQNK